MILDCIRGLSPWRLIRWWRPLPPIPIFSCREHKEIIWLILGHLPPESVAAFALTCSWFKKLIYDAREDELVRFPLGEEERLRVVDWIEKDVPHLYKCYECKYLHHWNPGQGLKPLVMNRHLYGELHGPALQDFSYTTQTGLGGRLVQNRSWSPRIIGDELYFKITTQLYHDQGLARNLRMKIDDIYFSNTLMCQHVSLTKPLLRRYRTYELDKPLAPGMQFAPVTGPLRSCPRCFTDFCIDVEYGPLPTCSKTMEGWIITITRWHQLGKFRSPEDTKWYNFQNNNSDDEQLGPQRKDISEAGMVYSNWSAQDDESAEPTADDGIVQTVRRGNAGFVGLASGNERWW
ncbi:hypothetical protein F5144DRAFT_647272 [Chaetomium tenue]|uniref:Uncharacterized protein n=1 Tax=Chaetomium tenue TaxID=1854479 RepID=A0ACB7PDS1_9PEZI|nr:hypothetical protein F5144DRAFT_647272 [Chaetomium globosum]